MLSNGWKERLIAVHNENTGGGTGLCLDVHDLAASKLVAGRKKDLEYVGALLRHQLVKSDLIQQRLESTPIPSEGRALCFARLKRLAG